MKNKTIQILSEGEWKLPTGTKVKTYKNGELFGESVVDNVVNTALYQIFKDDGVIINTDGYIYEVDFSDLPPLYPTKGMEVPEEGIEFADGNGKLIDSGSHGITYVIGNGETYFERFKSVDMANQSENVFELKRTPPKTITVCANGCFKEVCECVHDEGWYRVNLNHKWTLRHWNGEKFGWFEKGDHINDTGEYYEIDWNPINVIPEGEA